MRNTDSVVGSALYSSRPRERRALRLSQSLLALLFLNFLTTFGNLWPSALIVPGARIGPEFVALWVFILALVALFGHVGRRASLFLTLLFVLISIGRYAEVTMPALMGRPLNLYWDAPQLPRFLSVASQDLSGWQIAGIIVAFIAGMWLLGRMIRIAIETLSRHAAPAALRSPIALLLTVASLALLTASALKVETGVTLVASPVSPFYLRQADILLNALLPARRAQALPPSPPLNSDLGALAGAEVKVLFLESYGAITYDRDDMAHAIGPARERFAQAAGAQGRQVLSGFVRAATFAGASDLSHLSFLSGLDLSDPLRHDLLLETKRKTLLDAFEQAGYRSIGLYPSVSWDWPEKAFYDFDHYLDGPSLDYRGPRFGLWWLPDQFAMARVDELFPPGPAEKPRLLFFPTMSSHIPFRPTPPYQPDWGRITSDQPFSDEASREALREGTGWSDLLPAYIRSIDYTFQWLSGYQALPQARESVLVLLGDHQPASRVSGPGSNWDVPVHIVTANPMIADRLRRLGLQDGVEPKRRPLGHISALGPMLLSVFDSGEDPVAGPGRKVAGDH